MKVWFQNPNVKKSFLKLRFQSNLWIVSTQGLDLKRGSEVVEFKKCFTANEDPTDAQAEAAWKNAPSDLSNFPIKNRCSVSTDPYWTWLDADWKISSPTNKDEIQKGKIVRLTRYFLFSWQHLETWHHLHFFLTRIALGFECYKNNIFFVTLKSILFFLSLLQK